MGQTDTTRLAKDGEQVGNAAAPIAVNIPAAVSPLAAAGDIGRSRYGSRALSYLDKNGAHYGIRDAASELVFLNETIDELKQKHVRFQQVKDSVPVWGRQLIVHLDEMDNAVHVSGSFLSGVGDVDVRPSVTGQAAEAAAGAVRGEGWRAAGATLYVFEYESRPRLVYYVTVTRGLERWFVLVDAHDGAVLRQMSGMPSAAFQ